MTELLTKLFEFLAKVESNYGWVPIVFFLLVYILWVVLKEKIMNFFHNHNSFHHNKDKLDNNARLEYHPFFSNARYRLDFEIPLLELMTEKPVKQQMFRDLLHIFVSCLYDGFKSIVIIETEMEEWSPEKWSLEISKKMNEIVMNFKHTACMGGIPLLAIEKFNRWNGETIENLFEYIFNLGNSNIFSTNKARTNTFLYLLQLLLVTTIGDAEKSLREINGQLAGMEYKNQEIEG